MRFTGADKAAQQCVWHLDWAWTALTSLTWTRTHLFAIFSQFLSAFKQIIFTSLCDLSGNSDFALLSSSSKTRCWNAIFLKSSLVPLLTTHCCLYIHPKTALLRICLLNKLLTKYSGRDFVNMLTVDYTDYNMHRQLYICLLPSPR